MGKIFLLGGEQRPMISGTQSLRDLWVSTRDRIQGVHIRMFCLPHAGSGASVYQAWKREMPSFVELCPLRLPGREARISETAYSNYKDLTREMADALIGDCDIPYVIFGHSMGAVLAYEFAHELKRRGASEPLAIILSGRVAAHIKLTSKPLHELPLEDFIREIGLRYGELPQEVLADREMLDFYLPILRTDLRLIETYRYEVKPPLRCPILVAGGAEDQSIWSEGLEAWREHTTGACDVLRYEGGHFYLAGPAKAQLLQMLRNKLISLDSGLYL